MKKHERSGPHHVAVAMWVSNGQKSSALGTLGSEAYGVNRNEANTNKGEGQEGGGEKGPEEGESGEGEIIFWLGQELDAPEVREAEGSEWPLDF